MRTRLAPNEVVLTWRTQLGGIGVGAVALAGAWLLFRVPA